VQAHTSGEVGILGTILLRVYSRTTFAIFIEIGLYLTDKEQKISWHSFFKHGVQQDTGISRNVLLQMPFYSLWVGIKYNGQKSHGHW